MHITHIYRRTIEIPQRTRIFKVNCCLKVHKAPLKLVSPISGYVPGEKGFGDFKVLLSGAT